MAFLPPNTATHLIVPIVLPATNTTRTPTQNFQHVMLTAPLYSSSWSSNSSFCDLSWFFSVSSWFFSVSSWFFSVSSWFFSVSSWFFSVSSCSIRSLFVAAASACLFERMVSVLLQFLLLLLQFLLVTSYGCLCFTCHSDWFRNGVGLHWLLRVAMGCIGYCG